MKPEEQIERELKASLQVYGGRELTPVLKETIKAHTAIIIKNFINGGLIEVKKMPEVDVQIYGRSVDVQLVTPASEWLVPKETQ